jgi:hypothetical protein
MSNKKHKGIFIQGVQGGRETPKMAPTPPAPPKQQQIREGREVQKLMPPPPKPAVPPTPSESNPKK